MGQDRSHVALLALGTAVPRYRYQQAALYDWMAEALDMSPALRRWTRQLYHLSGIETRYSCLPDAGMPPAEARVAPRPNPAETPTTAERMAIYQREASALGTLAAQRALAEYADTIDATADDIADTVTHLIAVSCTGFFAPGLDQVIARQLNLPPALGRTLVGFMGCAAAFNGLRLADQIVRAQPSARVLVVCVEICSIHMHSGSSRIDLITDSLFADGAAACLIGAPPLDGHDHFVIDDFYSELVPDTAHEMVWRIGDHGFTLHLSPDIPRRLGEVAPRALAALLAGRAMPRAWAIHPGGRAIVDRLAELFELAPEQVAPTFDVLRHYGNMSSPTILFVLAELRERLRRAAGDEALSTVAIAFGPGLVVETAHLTYLPSTLAQGHVAELESALSDVYVA
jgi:predicted naringenin-chalcone synthase